MEVFEKITPKVWHAYYSKKHNDLFGYSIWADENGKRKICSVVFLNKEENTEYFLWDDKVYIGEVVDHIQSNYFKFIKEKYSYGNF